MTTWADLPLSQEHAAVLSDAAVTPAVAGRIGVRTAYAVTDLPEDLTYLAEKADVFPALLFPWREPDGTERIQIKPASPVLNGEGKYAKYLFGKGNHAQLTAVAVDPESTRVLIVEGSKQSLAAASYRPYETDVYGILGCRGWSKGGVPTPHLSVVEDKDVYVCLDGDVTSNLDVYNAALALAEACHTQGAASVKFIRLAAGQKAGLDDVLGAQPEDRRAGMMGRFMERAAKKPADAKPKPKRKTLAEREGVTQEGPSDRPTVVVNGDPHLVINDLTKALGERWDGTRLFNFGNALSSVSGHVVTPLEKGEFLDLLAGTARMVRRAETADGETKETAGWPDANAIMAVASRGTQFTPLDQVSRVPFVRADGTVCVEPGYDPASRTLLAMPEGLEVPVADNPSPEGVALAVKYLLDEWLADFPFPTPGDKANALALALTPLTRGLYPLVPVAVVNGLQAGVGKNLFSNILSLVLTGELSRPLPYNRDDEEQRKVMTSVFRTGQTFMVWDECHHLEGAHLARALTSPTYTDRVLGGSVLVEFPNRATWMTLGNQVRVEGDMVRRVYEIRMKTDLANPQDRPSSAFRHPDIEGWTRDNRGTILAALLTLVRAWHAAGRPGPEGGTWFGSFEGWQRTVGGILAHAGVPGFLDNVKEFRSESDFSVGLWELHLAGLWEHFGTKTFSAKDVKTWLDRNPDTAEAPPRLHDTTGPGYTRDLGTAYLKQRDRWYGQYRLERAEGTKQGKSAAWRVVRNMGGEGVPPAPTAPTREPEGPEGPEGPISTRMEKDASGETSNHVVTDTPKDTSFFTYRDPGASSGPSDPPEDPFYSPAARPETRPAAARTGAVGGHRPPVNPFAAPADPLDAVLALAVVPGADLDCPECGTRREGVPPSRIGYACPVCQPDMFADRPPF